jgi:apolipoprotein D and lipocalin family protein
MIEISTFGESRRKVGKPNLCFPEQILFKNIYTLEWEPIIYLSLYSRFNNFGETMKSATILLLSAIFVFGGENPAGQKRAVPVKNFELQKYLGTWYEVARMPVPFENGLVKVTATYSPGKNGKVIVLNRGIREKNNKESVAKGKAKFASNTNTGHLKVSFFGPFYADYIITELDTAYTYAMITGNATDYLWILSRTPTIDKAILDGLIEKAAGLGIDTKRLIFTPQ